MARSKALTTITSEAKRLKRKYPHRFNKLRKKDRWAKGYIKQASAIYAAKHKGKSPVGRKRKRKGVGAKVTKRKVTTTSVTRAIGKIKRRVSKRKSPRRRNVVMAGTRRRRSVGKKDGSSKMLIGLAIGAAAIYFLTRNKQPTAPVTTGGLPPLNTTNNQIRNSQAQNIIAYATAAGIALSAISNLIDKLNSSSDDEVNNIYDYVNTTGSVDAYV